MDFQSARTPGPKHKTDVLVLFRGAGAAGLKDLPVVDEALRKAAASAVNAGEFKGEKGQLLLLHGGDGGRRLLLAGLGKAGSATLRGAGAGAARRIEAHGLSRATFLIPAVKGLSAAETAGILVEGAGLAGYRFTQLKSKGKKKPRLRRVSVAPERGSASGLAAAVRTASAVVDAVAFARDLGNYPGNIATPIYLARRARELAGGKLTVKIHTRSDIKRLRMGAFAAVAEGSKNPPRLIEFRYRGAGPKDKTVALVGKGVTFDTGGISIKPSAAMEEMKFDMCGGAAVLGVMHLIAALEPKLNVHALVPATDNMPDGSAYRPGDVLKARNGKTIEVISTDAEGRLLLCDALAYASEKKPACLIDLATLTGACMVALGDAACGLFSNDDGLRTALADAGGRCGEEAWPLPLFDRYTEMMRGTYADLKNGGGRKAGACTAAAFLKEFVGDVPWAHLDIAGVAWTGQDAGHLRKGATGFGVRLLWEFLRGRVE